MGTGIAGPEGFCPSGLAVPAIPARKGGGACVMKYALRKTGASALIFPGAVVVGDVELGKGVSIWYNAVVRGDEGAVSIGDNTNVQDGVIVHADTKVGCGCTIGHRAVVHGCTIGDNTLVGMGAILLDGARIGRDCVIGAGALVTGGTEIPDGTLALGSPARVVRALTEEEIARNREYMLDYLNMSREARDMQEEPDGHGRESGR